MSISDDSVQKFKEIFKKDYAKEMSDEEAREAGESLVDFFEILWKMSQEDVRRKNRLKKEPKGFPVESQHTCIVCYRIIDPQTGWYDHNNQKCLSCQKAVDDGTLPSFVCHHRKSFFLMWELKEKFNIHSTTARKLVRQGKLVARIVRNDQYNLNEHVFLKKENLALFDRYSPARKSYDRHRAKRSEESSRKMKADMRATKREQGKHGLIR